MPHTTKFTGFGRHYSQDSLRKIFLFSSGVVVGATVSFVGWFQSRDTVVDDNKAVDATSNAIDRIDSLIRNYIGLGGSAVSTRAESQIYVVLMSPYEIDESTPNESGHQYIREPEFIRKYFLDGWGRLMLTDIQLDGDTATVTVVSRGPSLFDRSDDILVVKTISIDEAKFDAKQFLE